MKKITLLISVLLSFLTISTYSQIKTTIILKSPHWEIPYWAFDVWARVPAGQTWKVGSCNIRIDFYTIPSGKLTIKTDNPAINANTNLSSNANYGPMFTSSINGGAAISVNIQHNAASPCYQMNAGDSLRICTIRFQRTDSTYGYCTHDTIRCHTNQTQSSPVYDSLTLLTYPSQWARRNPLDTCTVIVGIENKGSEIPTVFKLYNNYPNPFNPKTTIKYDVPHASFVKIAIFDILGKEIEAIVNERKEPGSYEIQWDASNFASGAYFYKLETESFTDIKKMILIK